MNELPPLRQSSPNSLPLPSMLRYMPGIDQRLQSPAPIASGSGVGMTLPAYSLSSYTSPRLSYQPSNTDNRTLAPILNNLPDQLPPKDLSPRGSTHQCSICGVTTTPLWRRDPNGKAICNACGELTFDTAEISCS